MPSTKTATTPQPRLRVFAGPNGSGKSTIVKAVKNTVLEGRPIDFGYYINADEITEALKKGKFSFARFKIKIKNQQLISFVKTSGLLDAMFTLPVFIAAYQIKGNSIVLANPEHAERIGQVVARFLREEMLRLKRRFSFETVFSHESNLDIMERARDAGYKVYLYFVSTEAPEINQYRVALRVQENGHNVPPDKIKSRYYRSLDLMFDAAQLAYQAFFFDNSLEGQPFKLTAHFKKQGDKKVWDKINKKDVPNWFKIYYSDKVKKKKNKSSS